ncbi:MAG TPA: PP2C family serine/threonine-protein phosphatase [Wenzhouxiangellaceae bacterium]|nr:PP2C family serine/threonine-protein phosphatase [Wenzhouxiangellaceae bacterium]
MSTVASVDQFLRTDAGAVRERNEDDLLARPEHGLWAVCDGMGGHDAGDYASQHIVGQLSTLRLSGRHGNRMQAIKRCLRQCNRHLVDYAQANGFDHVGSTAVALCLHGRRAALIWVGDSRAYLMRDGRLRMISRDHSVAEEMAALGAHQVVDCPSAITRAVGATESIKIDMACLEARPGDVWLLCSDGISGVLDSGEMRTIMEDAADPSATLVHRAIASGSSDNCTAVVVKMNGWDA